MHSYYSLMNFEHVCVVCVCVCVVCVCVCVCGEYQWAVWREARGERREVVDGEWKAR